MILKGTISFDKENLPSYIFKYNVAMVSFFAGWFVLCLPPMIAVGYIYGENPATYITMIALFGLFFIGLLILYITAMKLRERLIDERTAEIEEEFADMPLEKAEAILKGKGIITESGFVAQSDVFGNTVIPFEKLNYYVMARLYVFKHGSIVQLWTRPSKIDVFLQVYTDGENGVEYEDEYPLDGALFNFLDKRNLITNYEDNRDFALLKDNKRNFCRMALGYKMK